MTKAVWCIAISESQAQLIIRVLRQAGTSIHDISLLCLEQSGAHCAVRDSHTLPSGSAVAGAGEQRTRDNALVWMLEISTLSDPDGAGYFAAGPILALLAGRALGARGGTIAAALVVLGLPRSQAAHYVTMVRTGRFLISVHSDSQSEIDTATQLFRDGNAKDIVSLDASPTPRRELQHQSSQESDRSESTAAKPELVRDAAAGIFDTASTRPI